MGLNHTMNLAEILSQMQPTKHKVFVSYHHGGDQGYYDQFARIFASTYDVITDTSLRDPINSDNADYVMQRIRQDYITGSSCTIVLCGRETPWRKYVDWEIRATLDKEHGLIGVNLPTNLVSANNTYTVPDRLHDNIVSKYAVWTDWRTITADLATLPALVQQAKTRPANMIINNREMLSRNLQPPWRS